MNSHLRSQHYLRLICLLAILLSNTLPLLPLQNVVTIAQAQATTDTQQVVTQQPANPQKSLAFNQLLAKAQAAGSVRVIVGLTLPLPFDPEGDLTGPEAIRLQRATIAQQQQTLLQRLAEKNVTPYAKYKTIPFLALKVDAAALTALQNAAEVFSINEDKLRVASLASSTTVIGMPAVWTAGNEGAGAAVVIIDSGVDAQHPFLNGRVVAEACFSNADGAGDGLSLCPNGQGQQIGSGAANAKIPACIGPTGQFCDHGTHVAGIAAGNGSTFDGVARQAEIVAIQVFTRFGDEGLSSFDSDQIRALEYVLTLHEAGTLNIAAVNMSLGGGEYNDQATCDREEAATKAVIDNLRSVDIATVIASGNASFTNALGGPGCISSAVAVGATTDSDAVAAFSNMHEMVDLLAPGVDIDSSITNGQFDSYNGTSMAAPHVAGAWAVLKAIQPSATVAEILALLQSTGVNVRDNRSGGTVTKARIQVDEALATPQLATITPDNGDQGATLSVAITGSDTHFASEATEVDFGDGITVDSVTVTSATALAAAITIDSDATPGVRPVTVTTAGTSSDEVVSKAGGFTINGNSGTPVISALDPDNGDPGETLVVTIDGVNTNFVSGRTEADFGLGITVENVTVVNATQVTVEITVAADAEPGARTVTLTTGAEVVSAAQGFRVNIPVPPTGNATLYFDPALAVLNVGETKLIEIVASPGNTPINGVQISGKIDPTYLQLRNVTHDSTHLDEVLEGPIFDASTGTFRFAAGVLGATVTEPFTLLTLEVKALAATGNQGTPVKFIHTFPATDITGPSGTIMEAALDGTVVIGTVGANANLHGKVDLQGRPDRPAASWSVPITLELMTTANSAPLVYTTNTDDYGEFTVADLNVGDYSVRVKSNHTLGNQIDNVTLVAGENNLFFGTLLEGDVETDRSRNQTVLADFGQLSGSFDRCRGDSGYLFNADLNEADACVTIADFGLLSPNFNTQGWIVYDSPLQVPAPLPVALANALLSFGQTERQATIGTTLELPLYVDPRGGDAIVGVTADLRYDPALLEVSGVTLSPALPKVLLKPVVDSSQGSVRFSVAANLGQQVTTRVQIATLQVKLKQATDGATLTPVHTLPRESDIAGSNGSVMAEVQGITVRGNRATNGFSLFLPIINSR